MKRTFAIIALLAAAPAFASDVDLVPFGYVSHVMRTTAQAAEKEAAVRMAREEAARRTALDSARTRGREATATTDAASERLAARVGAQAFHGPTR